MRFKKKWDLRLIVIYMRFKCKMSYLWDFKNKTSYYKHIKIKLHICVLLVINSRIWHVFNCTYVDLYFSDAWTFERVCCWVWLKPRMWKIGPGVVVYSRPNHIPNLVGKTDRNVGPTNLVCSYNLAPRKLQQSCCKVPHPERRKYDSRDILWAFVFGFRTDANLCPL